MTVYSNVIAALSRSCVNTAINILIEALVPTGPAHIDDRTSTDLVLVEVQEELAAA